MHEKYRFFSLYVAYFVRPISKVLLVGSTWFFKQNLVCGYQKLSKGERVNYARNGSGGYQAFFVLTIRMHMCTRPKKICAQIFYSIKMHHHSWMNNEFWVGWVNSDSCWRPLIFDPWNIPKFWFDLSISTSTIVVNHADRFAYKLVNLARLLL